MTAHENADSISWDALAEGWIWGCESDLAVCTQTAVNMEGRKLAPRNAVDPHCETVLSVTSIPRRGREGPDVDRGWLCKVGTRRHISPSGHMTCTSPNMPVVSPV